MFSLGNTNWQKMFLSGYIFATQGALINKGLMF